MSVVNSLFMNRIVIIAATCNLEFSDKKRMNFRGYLTLL